MVDILKQTNFNQHLIDNWQKMKQIDFIVWREMAQDIFQDVAQNIQYTEHSWELKLPSNSSLDNFCKATFDRESKFQLSDLGKTIASVSSLHNSHIKEIATISRQHMESIDATQAGAIKNNIQSIKAREITTYDLLDEKNQNGELTSNAKLLITKNYIWIKVLEFVKESRLSNKTLTKENFEQFLEDLSTKLTEESCVNKAPVCNDKQDDYYMSQSTKDLMRNEMSKYDNSVKKLLSAKRAPFCGMFQNIARSGRKLEELIQTLPQKSADMTLGLNNVDT